MCIKAPRVSSILKRAFSSLGIVVAVWAELKTVLLQLRPQLWQCCDCVSLAAAAATAVLLYAHVYIYKPAPSWLVTLCSSAYSRVGLWDQIGNQVCLALH